MSDLEELEKRWRATASQETRKAKTEETVKIGEDLAKFFQISFENAQHTSKLLDMGESVRILSEQLVMAKVDFRRAAENLIELNNHADIIFVELNAKLAAMIKLLEDEQERNQELRQKERAVLDKLYAIL